MPDMTMCQDDRCELSGICYRFKATPDEYQQAYFADTPRVGDECEYFIRLIEEKR